MMSSSFLREFMAGAAMRKRTAAITLVLAVFCGVPPVSHADVTIGGACPGGAQSAQSTDGNNVICASGTWQYPAYTFQSGAASIGSSCAGTTAGTVRYNTTLQNTEFCDGTTWTLPVKTQRGTSTGTGYFVMSHDTWTGNLKGAAASGIAGADAKCLSDLTTYTSWMGYSDANSRGLLDSTHVKAFVCVSGPTCNNPTASTTYYFAECGQQLGGRRVLHG